MSVLIRCYDKCMSWTHGLQSLLLFVIRIIWGWQFMWIGWGKLTNIEATADFFETLGIAQPETMAWIVGSIECVGGALILIGLITRLAALPLAGVMIGAYATAHTDAVMSVFSDFEMFTAEPPFLFLYAALILLCFGPGKLSVDYLIRGKEGK